MKRKTALLAALLIGAAVFSSGCKEEEQELAAVMQMETEDGTESGGTESETDVDGQEQTAETDSDLEETVTEPESETDGWDTADRPKVRGIYVTGPMAGTDKVNKLIELVDETELNALVIDIKNDEGCITCDMDVSAVNEIGSVKRYVKDMPALVQKCKEKGIYLIARIVAFKDPFLAEAKPEWSLHNADGSIFRDKSGLAWVNPYEQQVWEYLTQVAEGAVELGFDEVQFDYIRFSTDSGMKQVDFGEAAQEKAKEEVIAEFAAYAAKRLHDKGAAVSADVYGVVIDSEVDQQIVGQDYVALANQFDYLSPMIYPSHYGTNNYNIPIPDAQPYETVLAAMQASKKILAGMLPRKADAGTDSVSGNDIETEELWVAMTAEEITPEL